MSVRDPQEVLHRLREFNAALAEATHDLQAEPGIAAEVGRLVALLADRGLLEHQGYYTLEQACGKICDALEKGGPPRLRTFAHCGQSHSYHALQTTVVCPVCRQYRAKTRRFFAQDEVEDVAGSALHWLAIDWKTIPGWNPACTPNVE